MAMQNALASVLRHQDLIVSCDHVASQVGPLRVGSDYMQEDTDRYHAIKRLFIR